MRNFSFVILLREMWLVEVTKTRAHASVHEREGERESKKEKKLSMSLLYHFADCVNAYGNSLGIESDKSLPFDDKYATNAMDQKFLFSVCFVSFSFHSHFLEKTSSFGFDASTQREQHIRVCFGIADELKAYYYPHHMQFDI